MARLAKDTTEASEQIRKEFADIWDHLTTGNWFQEPASKVPEESEEAQ
jgi:hypothetical protein